jgi:hypothetical protein
MNRPLLTVLALALLAAALAPALAAPQDTRAALEAELRVERRLLARDLAAHVDARTRERTALARAEESAGRRGVVLRGNGLTLAAFERLQADAEASRDVARAASERVLELQRRIAGRLQRIAGINDEMGAGPRLPDPLSGRWRVGMAPPQINGTFELQLDGTLVSGKYQFENGPAGSLRGTFVDNNVRLDRIDARTGFDTTFIGTLDPAAGRISGVWQATELASGQPASGQWTAVRVAGR